MRTGDKAVSGHPEGAGAIVWDYAQWGHDKAVIKTLLKWVAVGLLLVLGFTQHRNRRNGMTTEQVFDYLANLFYAEDTQEHREIVSKIQKLLIQATGYED